MTRDKKTEGKLRYALLESRDFERALESLDQDIEEYPRDSLLFRERAYLHLFMGQAQKARSDFDFAASLQAKTSETRIGRLHSDSEYCAIGVTYWMEGHRDLALAFWRYVTHALCANRVSYAHMGGGIETGLLLWFGAIHARNEEDLQLVQNLYEKRLASKFWSHDLSRWPGPLVKFFQKNMNEQDLLQEARNCEQYLCYAQFALAIRARELRRHAAYWKHLKLVAPRKRATELYDFYNVLPYFVAKFELDQSSK